MFSKARQPTLLPWGAICRGGVRKGTMPLARLSPHFLSLPLLCTSSLCLFRYWFLGEWACVHSRTLWVSPTTPPLRLGVYSAASTPRSFFSQRFWGFCPVLQPWVARYFSLSSFSSWFIRMQIWDCPLHQPLPCSPQSSSYCLAASALHPGCPCPHLIPVWMNVSSLTPCFSDFHAVWFSWQFCFCFLIGC